MQKYLRISKKSSTFAHFFVSKHSARCHRITVSTQDFHSCNRGSIPLGTTKTFLKSTFQSQSSQGSGTVTQPSASRTQKNNKDGKS